MRLIDADALENDNWNTFEDEYGLPVKYVLVEDIRHAPTIDAVEVVRCKDCTYRVEDTKMCAHPRALGWDALETEDNDFCSYGERKGNGV